MTAAILAHQGGWDEALFVIGPLALIIVLLRMAKRRADAATQPERTDAPVAVDDGAVDEGALDEGVAGTDPTDDV